MNKIIYITLIVLILICGCFSGHTGQVTAIAFHPNGHEYITGDSVGNIVIRKINSIRFERLFLEKDRGRIIGIEYNELGTKFVTCSRLYSYGNFIEIWNSNGRREKIITSKTAFSIMKVIPKTSIILIGLTNGEINAYNFEGNLLFNFKAHESEIFSLDINKNSNYLLSCSKNKIKIWDIHFNLINVINEIESIDFVKFLSHDQLIIGLNSGIIKIISIKLKKVLKTIKAHNKYITSIDICSIDNNFITCSNDNTLKIWDNNGYLKKNIFNYGDVINCIKYSPNCSNFITGSRNWDIKIWTRSGDEINKIVLPLIFKKVIQTIWPPTGP